MIKTKRLIWLISIIFIVLFCGTGLFFIIDHTTKSASYTLTLKMNGGIYSSSASDRVYTYNTGSMIYLPVPQRAGYKFMGWMPTSYASGAKMTQGTMVDITTNVEPTFDDGKAVNLYNNTGNGLVTHTLMNTSLVHSPYNKQWLRIANRGTVSPGLGGFDFQNKSYANRQFYVVIQAKIPEGYTIQLGSNAVGDGSVKKWLTDCGGTGDFKTYVHYIKCGSTGTFSSTNFFFFLGTAGTSDSPVNFDISSAVLYEATSSDPDVYISQMSRVPTYTFGSASQTLIALWEKDYWTDYADTSWAGSGSATSPYLISSAEELAGLALRVRDGENFTDIYFKQTTNIYLGGKYWYPIGTNNEVFDGIYDGANYTINNLQCEREVNYQGGLFGVNWGTIQNVRIQSAKISGVRYVGGLVGSNFSEIYNCNVNAQVYASDYAVGGITGNCGSDTYAIIKNCTFTGNVVGESHYVGGIVGVTSAKLIENCHNSGTILSENGSQCGGIIGELRAGVISKCTSTGAVENRGRAAGALVGTIHTGYSPTIYPQVINCSGFGDVNSGEMIAGGLVGSTTTSNTTTLVKNCSFYGTCNTDAPFINILSSTNMLSYFTSSWSFINGKGYYSSGDFSGWSIVNSMNNGLPIQNELYSVALGGFTSTQITTHLKNKGFSLYS